MCDGCNTRGSGWKGWISIPEPSINGVGPWSDLSYALTDDLSKAGPIPKPVFRQLIRQPEAPANVTEIQMAVHYGTHVDSPRHFFLDGPAMEDVPLNRMYGSGVIWRIPKNPIEVISADDFERARPLVEPGDMVMLDTGWAKHMRTERYEQHPYLSNEAAQWLVDRRVKLLGVDFGTPDLPGHLRPAGFDWPVHQILLKHGVLVAEHMTNLTGLAGKRVEIMFLGLSITGSDGSPARAVARPLS